MISKYEIHVFAIKKSNLFLFYFLFMSFWGVDSELRLKLLCSLTLFILQSAVLVSSVEVFALFKVTHRVPSLLNLFNVFLVSQVNLLLLLFWGHFKNIFLIISNKFGHFKFKVMKSVKGLSDSIKALLRVLNFLILLYLLLYLLSRFKLMVVRLFLSFILHLWIRFFINLRLAFHYVLFLSKLRLILVLLFQLIKASDVIQIL